MSSISAARHYQARDRRARQARLDVTTVATAPRPLIPWTAIAITPSSAPFSIGLGGASIRKPPPYVWVLTAIAIAAHGIFSWYATHHAASAPAQPKKTQLAIEFVRPPEPPKIEPPKPTPPKPVAPKAQAPTPPTAPPIQTSAAEPSDTASEAVGETVAPVVEGPPAPPPPVTAAFGRAGYLNNPPPEYPSFASDQGWEGNVLLRVRVLSTGRVEKVEVQKSSGHKVLDDEAVRTVRNWSFSPSKRGEEAIDGWASVPIEFKLDA